MEKKIVISFELEELLLLEQSLSEFIVERSKRGFVKKKSALLALKSRITNAQSGVLAQDTTPSS